MNPAFTGGLWFWRAASLALHERAGRRECGAIEAAFVSGGFTVDPEVYLLNQCD